MTLLELIIGPAGEIRGETRGFAGRSCLEASRDLLQTLGQTTSDRLTAEFYAIAQDDVVAQRCEFR